MSNDTPYRPLSDYKHDSLNARAAHQLPCYFGITSGAKAYLYEMIEDQELQVNRFCHQYLQLEPNLAFPEPSSLREANVQEAIFNRLFSDGSRFHGAPARYQAKVLKELVLKVEASIDDWDQHEVVESLMNALSTTLATPLPSEADTAQQKCYVTYHLSALSTQLQAPYLTLLENRSLISAGGTTGLRTWEAALHLGDYLCRHQALIRGRNVLELGAGTGYLSILCARHLGAAHVIASDGSDEVINNLPENFFLNSLQGSSAITPMDVKWGHALVGTEEQLWNGGKTVDIVLGADVTYDDSVTPALIGTLVDMFGLYSAVQVIIAATQRNEATFKVFMDICAQQGLRVEDLEAEVPPRDVQEGPFYNDQVPIRLCLISKES